MSSLPQVLIIELGSQYTLLIEREFRELGVRSVILEPKKAGTWMTQHTPKAIVLSGSFSSVYASLAHQPPDEMRTYLNGHPSVMVLGICYGMQWLASRSMGSVASVEGKKEYGDTVIELAESDCLFDGTPTTHHVWMSHGDSVMEAPPQFTVLARSRSGAIAAMRRGNVWGVQFHPEVKDTPYGKTILKNFLSAAQCSQDWQPTSLVKSIQDQVADQVGNRRAIFGFSGGVDSTTLSAILAPVLKDRLVAVTIDGGQLREDEVYQIQLNARNRLSTPLRVVNARQEFGHALKGVIDAEQKRKQFKEVYRSIFTRVAKEVGAEVVLQGTLAPDRIESGGTGGDVIKSHHNVGLDFEGLSQLHPIDHLFKYEIRALAKELGLPEHICNLQPFPGPGLFIRVIGTPVTHELLALVRFADWEVRKVLMLHRMYSQLSQVVVAYLGVNVVGVKGDARVYGGIVAVRAVKTIDFMTARGVTFPEEVVEGIKLALRGHPHIIRVMMDPTDKPPGTIEYE